MELPSWLSPQPTTSSTPLPAWLNPLSPAPLEQKPMERRKQFELKPKPTLNQKELSYKQFEMIWPRVIECVCGGSTLASALRDLPIDVDAGAFTSWLYKQPRLKAQYLEAKEIRAEHWAGEMIKYALGEETNPTELDRTKVILDTYKWLVSRQNRKEYGDVKTLEMSTTISITAALESASSRVIEATVMSDDDDVDLLGEGEFGQMTSTPDTNDEQDDEDE